MKRRGFYFQYLQDPSVPISYTTVYNRVTRNENELSADHLQLQQENEQLNMEIDEFCQDNLSDRQILNQNRLEDEHANHDDDESAQDMLNQMVVDEQYENIFYDDIENEENEKIEEDEPQINVELHENPNNVYVMNDHEDRRNEERVPIYPGAALTKEESNLLIISFMIRHNLSDVALEDLLKLIDCHIPRTLNVSKYKFLKEFPDTAHIKTFYYCPDCLILLNFRIARCITCTSCHKTFLQNSLKRNGHFFYIYL
ncbi:PREDICTED: uncharacterized protein LOC105461680 isoform X2 [Wasmannia auropunctata]|uniref:uncharacterized protein LOC105461680 isoform X2 n=1 Tax=Wasmannia auropunctata TaxID=64793 RepID=UPI0005EE8AAA|nr:PREDICTED: uncharacterized protein LOC105461680 isoform X2 [Wasmannia auropunctata]